MLGYVWREDLLCNKTFYIVPRINIFWGCVKCGWLCNNIVYIVSILFGRCRWCHAYHIYPLPQLFFVLSSINKDSFIIFCVWTAIMFFLVATIHHTTLAKMVERMGKTYNLGKVGNLFSFYIIKRAHGAP